MESFYHSYIHTYLNYANIKGRSTNNTKLYKLMILPKHTLHIINNKPQLYHTKELFKYLNIHASSKQTEPFLLFKLKVKSKLRNFDNEKEFL